MTSIRRRTTGGLLLRTIRFDERGILVPRSMNAFGARNAVLLLIGYRVGAMSWAGSI